MKKVVVITGYNSGIGKGLTQLYQKDGHTVIGLDKFGEFDNKTTFMVDVSDEELVNNTFDEIGKMYGKIDVLINCAGYAVFGATELVPTQDAKNMFDVNYFGILNCTKGAIKYMQKGARIYNISSACSIYAVPFRTHYSASKAAVSMLSYGLRMELKDFGIDVVAINPGDVRTNFSNNRKKTMLTNEKYGERIEKSAKQIAERESKRMTIEFATGKMYKIFNKKHTKPMYIVGRSIKFLNFVTRLVPTSWVLHFTNKYL